MKNILWILFVLQFSIANGQKILRIDNSCKADENLIKKYSDVFRMEYLKSTENVLDADLTAGDITRIFVEEFNSKEFNNFCGMKAMNYIFFENGIKIHLGLAVFAFDNELSVNKIFNEIINVHRDYLHLPVATRYKVIKSKGSLIVLFSESFLNPKITNFFKNISKLEI